MGTSAREHAFNVSRWSCHDKRHVLCEALSRFDSISRFWAQTELAAATTDRESTSQSQGMEGYEGTRSLDALILNLYHRMISKWLKLTTA